MTDELVRRLLGTDRQPLTCEQCFEELDRYVEWKLAEHDGPFELCTICEQAHECTTELECVAMRDHLDSCPACDEEYESLRELVLAEQGA